MPTTDLERAYRSLYNKQDRYTKLWHYYDGEQPLVYSTDRLREVFKNLNARFSENWCAVVVDAELERINLETMAVLGDEQLTERLSTLWQQTELDLDEELVHQAAMVARESYVIAWRDEGGPIEAYYNDPRQVHVMYDAERPREMRVAAKWWTNDDDRLRMTLYYADHIEYYVSDKSSKSVLSSEAGYKSLLPLPEYQNGDGEPDWPVNPFEQIPVFHFKYERRGSKSALRNVIEPQDAINKLLNDMMVAAEFGAFRQRWVISNADMSDIKSAPTENMLLPAGDGQTQDTSVGEFNPTDLANYIQAMDREANVIAAITRTPKHYFFDQGGNPSGEALIAQEAPLNKKAEKFIKLQTPVWRRLAAFLLRLDGVEIDELSIQPVFAPVQTVQPRTQADIRQISVNAGMPLRTVLRRQEGWTVSDIEQMEEDAQAEQEFKQLSYASALLVAEREFAQGADMNGAIVNA